MTTSRFDQVAEAFKKVQDHICNGFTQNGEVEFLEDLWSYDKGEGGGRTRVWEDATYLEKAGVNFSAISGAKLPPSALNLLPDHLKDQPFSATGVSLVIHPWNPMAPTIHMNIRYFECGDVFWFGGGVDLTPVYPNFDEVKDFHIKLKEFCEKYERPYTKYKEQCDDYFYLKHRKETRGVGGLFFDHLKNDFENDFEFVTQMGYLLNELYLPILLSNINKDYTEEQREFQLLRRSRYVEFNLLLDRGTHFGIQSEGRTESILMSMPARANWRYNHQSEEGTVEKKLVDFYLKPQDWINLKQEG